MRQDPHPRDGARQRGSLPELSSDTFVLIKVCDTCVLMGRRGIITAQKKTIELRSTPVSEDTFTVSPVDEAWVASLAIALRFLAFGLIYKYTKNLVGPMRRDGLT